MNIWAITDTGIVRDQNQDSYLAKAYSPEQAFAVVCDGMGGARAGNVASQLAVDAFSREVQSYMVSMNQSGDIDALLNESVQAANKAVYQYACENSECLGMGTTLVAMLMMEQVCHIVNVGDSRAYFISEHGIRRITRDHSLVEDLVERGEITANQARTHPQKNLITRALGVAQSVQVDLFSVDYTPGAYLLLCSDGLSNILTDQEILYEVIHGGEGKDCCDRLLSTVLSRGAPDNVTLVLLQM